MIFSGFAQEGKITAKGAKNAKGVKMLVQEFRPDYKYDSQKKGEERKGPEPDGLLLGAQTFAALAGNGGDVGVVAFVEKAAGRFRTAGGLGGADDQILLLAFCNFFSCKGRVFDEALKFLPFPAELLLLLGEGFLPVVDW